MIAWVTANPPHQPSERIEKGKVTDNRKCEIFLPCRAFVLFRQR